MTELDRLLDDIDELVDEQLAGGESGHRASGYPVCPHCGRAEHFLPLSQRVAEMYDCGLYNESYLVDADDSPVVCPGSTFIGPLTEDQSYWVRSRPARWRLDRPMLPVWGDVVWVGEAFGIATLVDALVDESVGLGLIQQWLEGAVSFSRLMTVVAAPQDRFHLVRWSGWVSWVWVSAGNNYWLSNPLFRAPALFGPPAWVVSHCGAFGGLSWELIGQVSALYPEFLKPDYPVPVSPGYDFSSYNEQINPGHSFVDDLMESLRRVGRKGRGRRR